MKRLLIVLLLSTSFDNVALHRAISPTHFNKNFGRRHFVVGYNHSNITPSTTKVRKLDQRDPIINGSSAHLIDESRFCQSFFSTKHNINSIVTTLINQAKEKVHVAFYTLTDPEITTSLLNAHKKGISVQVILDPGKMKQHSCKGKKLIANGILVCKYDPELHPYYNPNNRYDSLMHHKFIIIDNKIVITGSANGTQAASKSNVENIIILRDPQTIDEYQEEFERDHKCSVQCKQYYKTSTE